MYLNLVKSFKLKDDMLCCNIINHPIKLFFFRIMYSLFKCFQILTFLTHWKKPNCFILDLHINVHFLLRIKTMFISYDSKVQSRRLSTTRRHQHRIVFASFWLVFLCACWISLMRYIAYMYDKWFGRVVYVGLHLVVRHCLSDLDYERITYIT